MTRLLSILVAALAYALPAGAHVTVWPKQSVAGTREKYVVRVPNEKQVDSVELEVRFPAGLKVNSLEQKPAWVGKPLFDAACTLIGVRWTGKLAPLEYAEFGVLAVNPAEPTDLAWVASQTYSDGTKVEWSGPQGSKTPAARVTITSASAATH